MCLVLILTSVMVANATVFVDMNTINDYVNGSGAYAEGGGGGRHRWNGELTVKMRLIVSAFALAQGIYFHDPANSHLILEFYDNLSENDKKKIHAMSELADNVEDSYKVIASFSKDVSDFITGLISSFFTRERCLSSSDSVDYGQYVSFNGQTSINLSQPDQIFITTQSSSDPSPNSQDCHVDYKIAGFTLSQYYHTPQFPPSIHPNASSGSVGHNYLFLKPDNGDMCWYSPSDMTYKTNSVYSNLAFDTSYLMLSFRNAGDGSAFSMMFDHAFCFYSIEYDSVYCIGYVSDGRGYYFSHVSTRDAYKNLFFATKIDLLNYFFGQGNMSINQDFDVQEIDKTPDVIDIDEDKQTEFVNQVDNMSDDDVITIVIPTTTTYNNFVNNPDLLFDFYQDNLYDSPVDLPLTNGNKLATKFPFCIPFDFINLFSGFVAEPECPSFHILVMPADSFGFDNDDIYWDLDFSDYNYLVQLLRFFIALAFVFWLISITKHIIK